MNTSGQQGNNFLIENTEQLISVVEALSSANVINFEIQAGKITIGFKEADFGATDRQDVNPQNELAGYQNRLIEYETKLNSLRKGGIEDSNIVEKEYDPDFILNNPPEDQF
jgi:hypothetical protein